MGRVLASRVVLLAIAGSLLPGCGANEPDGNCPTNCSMPFDINGWCQSSGACTVHGSVWGLQTPLASGDELRIPVAKFIGQIPADDRDVNALVGGQDTRNWMF